MKKKDFFYSAFLALSMAFTMGAFQRNAIRSIRRRFFMTGVCNLSDGGAESDSLASKSLQMLKYFGMKIESCQQPPTSTK